MNLVDVDHKYTTDVGVRDPLSASIVYFPYRPTYLPKVHGLTIMAVKLTETTSIKNDGR